MAAMFFARLGHQLHPDTNAEKGVALRDDAIIEGINHAINGGQRDHAMGKGADTRQNNAIRMAHGIWISCDDNILSPSGFKRIPDRLEVSRAIIDQGEAHSIPLVEGMASALRASISTATRSARASAL